MSFFTYFSVFIIGNFLWFFWGLSTALSKKTPPPPKKNHGEELNDRRAHVSCLCALVDEEDIRTFETDPIRSRSSSCSYVEKKERYVHCSFLLFSSLPFLVLGYCFLDLVLFCSVLRVLSMSYSIRLLFVGVSGAPFARPD